MFKLTAAIVLTTAASIAYAETITIEAADGVKVVRWYGDSLGDTVAELIATDPDMMLQCIALDAAGEPLAVGMTIGKLGSARFTGIDAETVADVVCREG